MDADTLFSLRSADIFKILADDELRDLAGELNEITLPSGQPAVTQGERGSSLFIVKSGRLSVFIDDAGKAVYVGDLWDGEFFGEMSLLTGSPRTATVLAANTATVLEITKQHLAPLLQRHSELASHMGRVLSERQSSNLKTLMEVEHAAPEIEPETVAAQYAFRIKRFFDIPTSIWGKAVEGVSGFSVSGPLGYILGKSDPANTSKSSSGADDRQVAFTTAMITLAAKMAAAGGSYSQKEITQLREIFDIPPSDMANVGRIFNRAQGSASGFEPYAKQIAELFQDESAVLEELVVSLLRIARSPATAATGTGSTGAGLSKMTEFVAAVAVIFGFTAPEFERLKSMNTSTGSDGVSDDGPHYLNVLSIREDATPLEAKRAYHKLAMENHPDKLISQGMPEEFIRQSNEKLAMINNAYEQFCQAHKTA